MSLASAYPPATRGSVVVWGLLASDPFGGMTWQALHHVVGLRRLGFDVWYVEDSEKPMHDPVDLGVTYEPERNVKWLSEWMEAVGLGDRWILRPPMGEDAFGHPRRVLDDLYASCDAVLNVTGAHELYERHAVIKCLILMETDPFAEQVNAANGNTWREEEYGRHHHRFTYGTNIGAPDCPIPDLGLTWHPTVPPVCVDWWETVGPPAPDAPISTVLTWSHEGKDVEWDGRTWTWRKDLAFRPFLDLPRVSPLPIELAIGRIGDEELADLHARGWRTRPANELMDVNAYRDYIRASRGEFTATKEQYVATNSGWFSDRSVCYLAAGRPVVTQETGFSRHLPVGEGLFAFSTLDEAQAAMEAIASDYERHAAAASEIAREHLAAEKVLGDVMRTAGLL